MDFLQTYETTVASAEAGLSVTFLVIPTRTYDATNRSLPDIAEHLFETGKPQTMLLAPYVDPAEFLIRCLRADKYPLKQYPDFKAVAYADAEKTRLQFAVSLLNDRIIPFENSPVSPESLSSIASSVVRGGAVALGAKIGFIAGGTSPLLLVTVPAGIVLCGLSVSFAKYMEQNRTKIWNKLLGMQQPQKTRHIRPNLDLKKRT